jgi:mono/diheme cytochrome c family protein
MVDIRLRAVGICGAMLLATTATLAAEEDRAFAESIRPLFERKCFECHSSKADELKGNLKLETVEQVLKGGATGPAIVPGDTENSFLLRAIRYQEDDFQMPPSGRMTDEEIALVEKWVRSLKPVP